MFVMRRRGHQFRTECPRSARHGLGCVRLSSAGHIEKASIAVSALMEALGLAQITAESKIRMKMQVTLPEPVGRWLQRQGVVTESRLIEAHTRVSPRHYSRRMAKQAAEMVP